MAASSLLFPNGCTMPIIGFGTWTIQAELPRVLALALDTGYSLIDTAAQYKNEHHIGEVLKKRMDENRLKRDDVFISTKLGPIDMGSRERVRDGFRRTCVALPLDFIDLFLIHWPLGLKAMEELVDEGKIRSLGLSNFNSEQIERIRAIAKHPICNLQIECHVYFQQANLRDLCKQHGITVTCWSPLGSPNFTESTFPNDQPLKDPVVNEIARRHSKTPAQVLLRFLIQEGLCVIPRSTAPSRIQENIQVFDFTLSPEETEKLRSLGRRNQRLAPFTHLLGHAKEYPFNIPF